MLCCFRSCGEIPMASNERGPVAETYDELQGIPMLQEARSAVTLRVCSAEALIRTVLQCSEIALITLADLLNRSAQLPIPEADRPLSWAVGFHRILLGLSRLPYVCGPMLAASPPNGPPLRLARSLGYRVFRAAVRRLDRT